MSSIIPQHHDHAVETELHAKVLMQYCAPDTFDSMCNALVSIW